MKKNVLLSALLCLASFGYSQTYYYQCVADIDKDGVRKKFDHGHYVTFVKDKSIVYDSDEKGNNTSYNAVKFYYRRTQNGTHVYESKSKPLMPMPDINTGYIDYSEKFDGNFMYFSSDFDKYIIKDRGIMGLYGYEREYTRTEGPKSLYDDVPTF